MFRPSKSSSASPGAAALSLSGGSGSMVGGRVRKSVSQAGRHRVVVNPRPSVSRSRQRSIIEGDKREGNKSNNKSQSGSFESSRPSSVESAQRQKPVESPKQRRGSFFRRGSTPNSSPKQRTGSFFRRGSAASSSPQRSRTRRFSFFSKKEPETVDLEQLESQLGMRRNSMMAEDMTPRGPNDDPELYNYKRWVHVDPAKIPYNCEARKRARFLWSRVRLGVRMGRRFRNIAAQQRMYGHVLLEEKNAFERTDAFHRLYRHDSTLTDLLKKQKDPPRVVRNKTRWKVRWEATVLFLIFVYTLFYVPARAVFIDRIWHPADSVSLCIDLFFIVDIVMHFFVPMRQQYGSPYAIYRHEIAIKYLTGMFAVDLAANIPFYTIGLFYTDNFSLTGRALRSLRFLKLLRVLRVDRSLSGIEHHPWYKRVSEIIAFNPSWARIIQLSGLILVLSHAFACVWYYVAIVQNSQNSWIHKYGAEQETALTKWSISLYFFWTTLTTVGYGDVIPGTNTERFFATMNMIVGVTFYAYVTATLSSVVKSLDATAQEYRDKMAGLQNFMKDKHVSKKMQDRLRRHFRYAWQSTGASYDVQGLFNQMPPSMRSEVAKEVYQDVIDSTPFFRDKSGEFVTDIMTAVRPVELQSNEFVARRGEQVKEWYLIKRGAVEAVTSDGTVVLMTFGPGSTLGEIGIFADPDGKWPVDMITMSKTEMLAVPKGALLSLLEDYSGYKIAMVDVAMERYSRIHTAMQTYNEEKIARLRRKGHISESSQISQHMDSMATSPMLLRVFSERSQSRRGLQVEDDEALRVPTFFRTKTVSSAARNGGNNAASNSDKEKRAAKRRSLTMTGHQLHNMMQNRLDFERDEEERRNMPASPLNASAAQMLINRMNDEKQGRKQQLQQRQQQQQQQQQQPGAFNFGFTTPEPKQRTTTTPSPSPSPVPGADPAVPMDPAAMMRAIQEMEKRLTQYMDGVEAEVERVSAAAATPAQHRPGAVHHRRAASNTVTRRRSKRRLPRSSTHLGSSSNNDEQSQKQKSMQQQRRRGAAPSKRNVIQGSGMKVMRTNTLRPQPQGKSKATSSESEMTHSEVDADSDSSDAPSQRHERVGERSVTKGGDASDATPTNAGRRQRQRNHNSNNNNNEGNNSP